MNKMSETDLWRTFKTVTLSDGTTVAIRYVPPYLASRIATRFPDPPPPIRIIQSKLVGVPPQEEIEWDNPKYVRERGEILRQRSVAITEFIWNYAIVSPNPPADDDWKTALGIEFFVPDFQWREAAAGRRLDWIEYVLMANPNDCALLQAVIREASNALTQEEIAAAEALFRPAPRREPATEEPAGS